MLTLTDKETELIINNRLEEEHEEYRYLNLLKKILSDGTKKGDRTGTGTISIYGTQLKFDLRNSFPIFTTKKVYWKGIVEELLWFMRGDTNSKNLEAKGVNIWNGNTTRKFLDNKGLNYPEGEIGPGYGFQWRHWGGDYEGTKNSYKETPNDYFYNIRKLEFKKGIDQLSNVIDTLKNNPNDRRMIVSAWNVADINKMALPPCHLLFQFDVTDGYLNCAWYQRSVDSLLGLPFNVSSYALLTCLIAKIVGLKPGTLTFFGGDTHLYLNHLEQAKEQISRKPFPFPKLNIKKDIKSLGDIENILLNVNDIELIDYQSHAAIKAEMAI